MHSFRILTDAMLLHLAQQPLRILLIVFLLILAVTAILVCKQLRRPKTTELPKPPEDGRTAQ